MIGDLAIAIAACFDWLNIQSIELAMMFITLKACNHLVNEVINVEQFQLNQRVIDSVRQVVGKCVAERGHGTVVVGTAPLTEQVRETVNQHLCACFFAILQEKVFTSLLAAAIFAVAKATSEACLLAAAEHHRAGVAVLLEGV